jgi:hypothetical protein
MNTTHAVKVLFEAFRPAEVETIRKSRKHPNGKVTRERPATSITRRGFHAIGVHQGTRADATIAELLDNFLTAKGVTFSLNAGESTVRHALDLAATEGIIAYKRDKNGEIITKAKTDIPVGAWLVRDLPRRRAKLSKEYREYVRRTLLQSGLEALGLLQDDEETASETSETVETAPLPVPDPES